MPIKKYFPVTTKKPICIGTGLVTLDVIMNGHPQIPLGTWAGGSCGNVLIILSYLGWRAVPLARLGNDDSATRLLQDLRIWGVDTSFISQNEEDRTPIIVERLTIRKNGTVKHTFQQTCPSCGSHLPKYRAVTSSSVVENIDKPNVFYFDRVRKGSIELAKINKEKGALIIFEPSGIRDKELYIECLKLADIVKYSSDRIAEADELHRKVKIPLEIQTLGAEGLRYKHRSGINKLEWIKLPSYEVLDLKDPVGSGDWCTAGIIHLLGKNGKSSFSRASGKRIDLALKFGQALAALNCYFEGPRGGMYSIDKNRFRELVSLVLAGNSPKASESHFKNNYDHSNKKYTCPICEG